MNRKLDNALSAAYELSDIIDEDILSYDAIKHISKIRKAFRKYVLMLSVYFDCIIASYDDILKYTKNFFSIQDVKSRWTYCPNAVYEWLLDEIKDIAEDICR